MEYIREKIQTNLSAVKRMLQVKVERINDVEYQASDYKWGNGIPENDWKPFDTATCFKEVDKHYWFRMKVKTPKVQDGRVVIFKLHTSKEEAWSATNPQGLVYLDGKMTQAVDTNHTEVLLPSDSEVEIACYYYTGMLNERSYFIPHIIVFDKEIEALYYDVLVPFEATKLLEKNENYYNTMRNLEIALNMVNFNEPYSECFYSQIKAAREYLKTEFYGKECGKSDVTVSCIGHTHIDIAWLWTYAQTAEKAQRSFSTVLNLMKQYPEYKFMSSQAILYDYVKQYAPELYAEIKERVKEGRWEVDGAMWLECDCNLSSGESIIRQIAYGKRFMLEEFGKDSKILWLPDTFGYSAAMPQIMKKTGIDRFVTSKISWNDQNTMPHDTFIWEGIDGSEILTDFMTAQQYTSFDESKQARQTSYVPKLYPTYMLGAYARYKDKELNDRTMATFGYGDGGGGPTAEMLEYQRRMDKGLPGIPKSEITTAREHLDIVEKNFYKNAKALGRMPRWVGELYLELHRGTYTSVARVKRNNRKAEFAINKIEFLSSLLSALNKNSCSNEELEKIWKLILLNQFHDVVPGSSIKEVYEDSEKQYAEIFASCDSIFNDSMTAIKNNIKTDGGLLVLNSTSANGISPVSVDGKTAEVEAKAHSWSVISTDNIFDCKVKVSDNTIENDYYKVVFDNDGAIASLFDKRFKREIVKPNQKINQFKVFEDYPRCYDNWEINEYYKSKSWELGELVSTEPVFDGSRAGIKFKRKYLNSTMEQTVWLYSRLDRIDFDTKLDWHEIHQIVKVFFPLDIHTNKAVYDIQFGNAERSTHQNTSWDEAKFEVCGHKWVDLSDGNYGVSLLNDCKYGFGCIGNELSLTVLKCGTYPHISDQGEHIFTYSLLPHSGDFKNGTVEKAYILNQPFDAVTVSKQKGILPEGFNLISADKPSAVVETVKQAENGQGLICRIYDSQNVKEEIILASDLTFKKAYLCDMLEKEISELEIINGKVKFTLNNFEIATIKLLLK